VITLEHQVPSFIFCYPKFNMQDITACMHMKLVDKFFEYIRLIFFFWVRVYCFIF